MTSAKKPFIALNLKTYLESTGERGLKLCETANEISLITGVRIMVCPDATLLHEAAMQGADVYAQAIDGFGPGAFTGSINAQMLKFAGARGSLLNHSEHRVSADHIQQAVQALREVELESMVCAKDVEEAVRLAAYEPTSVAVEPPELIGSGISVSTAKPEVVSGAVQALQQAAPNVKVVCGAGISTAADVKKAIELGVDGVLLASAYVKAKDPRALLEEMARQI
jgi:triosephosphate isomerase